MYTVTLGINRKTEKWILLKIKKKFWKRSQEKLKKSKSRAFATQAKKEIFMIDD